MQNVYIYNDTFESLLNLCEILLKNKIKPFNIKTINYQASLFENTIKLDINNDVDIIKKFVNILGVSNFKIIYYVFLANENNKEIIIYYYLLNYFKYRDRINKMRNLKCVSEALRISSKVSRENHRFKGFTRFKELKNHVLYAEINPDNDILELLAWHFTKRLANENFIIKDINRDIMVIYDKKNIQLFSSEDVNFNELMLSTDEDFFQNLWQVFYQTIGIKERKNLKCRRNFMPKKYWQCILEVRNEL